jgi:hypothetical protein
MHGNATHQAACYAALATWNAAVAGTPTQATVKAADIAYFRAIVLSAKALNIESGVFRQALVELGRAGI